MFLNKLNRRFWMREVVIDIVVDAWMPNAVGSFDNLVDIVGNRVDFAVTFGNCLRLALHLLGVPAIEAAPEALANEEHWHFWHLAFLHENEDFRKFVHRAKTAREEDIGFACKSKHDFTGEEITEFH